MGEAAQEREATPEEIQAMQAEVRKGILAGALGFSVGNFADQGEEIFGVKVPSSVASDEERYAVGSVLGELGTGVFQVSGGAAGGYTTPAGIAQELSRRTGRPAIYNLLAQELSKPDEWKEHLQMVEDAFQVGHQGLRLLPVGHRRPHLRPARRVGRPGRRGHDQPHHRLPGHEHLGLGDGPAGAERIAAFADAEIRRALSIEGVETEGEHRYRMNRGTRTMSFNRRWDLVQVYMAHEERNRQYSGMSIEQIAQQQGKGIMDAFLDLVLDDDLRTSFQVIDRNSDPDAQREIWARPTPSSAPPTAAPAPTRATGRPTAPIC